MSLRRKRSTSADAPGQDSFLDVVANLVGILIILVMVIGTQAKQAMELVAPLAAEADLVVAAIDVDGAQQGVDGLERDVQDIKQKVQRQEVEIAYRRHERDQLNVLVVAAENAMDQRRDGLDEQQQRQFDQQRDVLRAGNELELLKRQRDAISNVSRTMVIDHLPTPMAKTVFGRELHFRLKAGRLAYVPWTELVELLKKDAPQRIDKLRTAQSFTETIGPVGDYHLRYTMKRNQRTLATQVGAMVQELAELEQFEVLPASEPLGETIEQALRPGSEFLGRVRHEDPRTTTVTVWVYPDGFDQYRSIKQALTQLGLLSAARPLPDGRLMGGSPHGRRSAAQ